MNTLAGFIAQELNHPVSWAKKDGEVRDDSVRGGKFFVDEATRIMSASDGGSILIRMWDEDEVEEVVAVAEKKPETHKLIKAAPPNLAGALSLTAVVGMNVGRLRRMLAEMDDETINVYLLKIKDGTYAIAFEQFGQVGIVAGLKGKAGIEHVGLRIWEKEEGSK